MEEFILSVSDVSLSDFGNAEENWDLPTADEIQREIDIRRERKFKV
jgi:hypothetical protein